MDGCIVQDRPSRPHREPNDQGGYSRPLRTTEGEKRHRKWRQNSEKTDDQLSDHRARRLTIGAHRGSPALALTEDVVREERDESADHGAGDGNH
ncbi:MAG: hypothetical protein ACRDN8_09230 [Thermoleophilaceae bacterium]